MTASFGRLQQLVAALPEPAAAEAAELLQRLVDDRREIEARQQVLAESQAEALVNAGIMMSEIEDAHAQVEQARIAAENASRAKSEFLANMSHEIRTPMNGVIGLLQLALEGELGALQRDRLDTAFRSARSLLALLNDILDLSKLEAGQFELERRPFSLMALLEDVAALFAPSCARKDVDLHCSVDPRMHAQYFGDAHRLTQVLTNLVGNAVKFTQRGEVALRATLVTQDGDVDTLRIDVVDTGIGIPPERLSQLFQPFSQVDASMSRRFGGTGLGLAIARRLAELMQGTLSVTSAPGAGSCFSFGLRLDAAGDALVRGEVPLSGRQALVIAPAGTLRATLNSYAGALGLDVRCVDSAEGAGADLTQADVVLVDVDHSAAGVVDSVRLAGVPCVCVGKALDADEERRPCVSLPLRYQSFAAALRAALLPDRAPAAEPEAASVNEVRFPGKRLLLVEDNPVNQMLALAMLDTYGVEVDWAGNGVEALARRDAGTFDLVLMDCQMPEMDGFEAAREWRRREVEEGVPPTPIIALTANALVGDREACLAAGMNDYLAKPFLRGELTDLLVRWLASGGASGPGMMPPRAVAAG